MLPTVVFTTPRKLPNATDLAGRVAVLDIAFTATGMGTPYEEMTGPFIAALGSRLAVWVDHHDHERHSDFAGDRRFVLATKAQHGACPEMVTPALVAEVGPVDTVVTHSDLDGLYAAAKWIREGREPYAGSDDDARAVDTRLGAPGPIGELIDKALRARFRDQALKHRIVHFLVGGATDREHRAVILQAAGEFDAMADEARRIAKSYRIEGRAALVDAGKLSKRAYDKTLLLLEGQKVAPVAIVRDSGMITAAAAFDSGIDFIRLLGLDGGMPTRISIAESRLSELLTKLNG